jgi:uncharacterized repeat protein (TIGR03803 family)
MTAMTSCGWGMAFVFGLVFASIPPAQARAQALTFDLLHTLDGSPDGSEPEAALLRDASGNLFGTAAGGGLTSCDNGGGCGTVFEESASGAFSVLYTFQGGTDGDTPYGGVTEDASGNLYGTTEGTNGGATTLWKLTQSGQKTILWKFGFLTGAVLNSAPVFDAKGNLFGAAQYGGDVDCGYNGNGCGVIYEYESKGKIHTLHVFKNVRDGTVPDTGIVIDEKGTLYGAAAFGGDVTCDAPTGCGVIFKLEPNGTYTVLHSFTGKKDGWGPGAISLDAAGNIYGTTGEGADTSCYPPLGCGVIYKIDTKGKFSVLFTFTASQVCCAPGAWAPIVDSKGDLYDSFAVNGAHGVGYVFKLDTKGNLTDLFDYPACGESPDGAFANQLIRDTNGNFYSTMNTGGGNSMCGAGFGTVFELTP